ncbi:MAG: universal stress protein UspE [Oceanospirillaceae bacterium]|nr:universal stress protein UspE [Oceanospirillaceae bacterium]|tara:strand:+ start:5201 stop:6127 length:927 start_codon:yes stop_codon:yes gene_type:complete
MLNITHILAVLDHQVTDDPALSRALWLAKSLKAELTLLTNAWDPLGDEGSHVKAEMRDNIRYKFTERAERWLEEAAEELRESGQTVQTEVLWHKHLHEAALEVLNQQDVDLVVKSVRTAGLIDRLFTHNDWNLLRHCPAPVLMVKNAEAWSNNRFIAAIDATCDDEGHTRLNDNLLAFAELFADHLNTDLHLFNAYPEINLTFAMVPEVSIPDELISDLREQHEKGAQRWASKYNVPEDHVHVGEGNTEDLLASLVTETGTDLVMLGSVGRKGISAALIGNTAEAVLNRVPCDVLVIKPQDGVSPDVD